MGGRGEREDWREREALWRYGLIREAADERLSSRERGQLVRALAGKPAAHPSGELRAPARSTLDDWIRAYRRGGFEALKPAERCPGPRTPAPLLEQAAGLRRELPARPGTQIAEILRRLHGDGAPSARTVERYLRRQGLSRARLQGRERAYGRFEASAPNELWVADVLHGPLLKSRRAYLFCVLDDHSRFVVGARFQWAETTLALESVLRTGFLALGLPDRLYVDNGSPFASKQLQRICAVLGIRLVHSAPGRPQAEGSSSASSAPCASSSWSSSRGASSTSWPSSTASLPAGCSRPTTGARTRRRARRLSPATRRAPRAGPTPATTPSSCARPSSGRSCAPSRRRRPSRSPATATRSTLPSSGGGSSCSTTPSTSSGSRCATKGAPSGSPFRTRSGATPTRRRRASRPRRSRRPRPASTTCACSSTSTSARSSAGSPTASFHPRRPRRRHDDAQPAQALLRLQPPAFSRQIPASALYRSQAHQEALARIAFLIEQEALGLLTGEVGAGKTVAARAAVASLDASRYTLIYLANPSVGARGLYHQIVLALGGEPHFHTAALIPQAHQLLAHERAERGKRVVVVIDEAHLLDPGQLEEIRLLTNSEMDSESPFAGILLGQPSLRKRLRLGSFAALDQRLALRYELPGMSPQETGAYLRHHLELAGRDDALFSDDAVALLHRVSRGIPRALNNLAIQALVAAFADQKAIVDESSARAAVTEITAE